MLNELLGRYPYLKTQYVSGVIQQVAISPDFMASKLFPLKGINAHEVMWDVELDIGGMTQAVAQGAESPIIAGGGFYQRRMAPAYFREKFHVMPHQLQSVRRLGTLNEVENVKTFIAKKVAALRRRIDTRIEHSLWQAIMGQLTINSNRIKFTVDYNIPTRFKPTITAAADKWTTTASANPLNDLFEWMYLFRGTGFKPVEVIYNAYIERLLLANTAVRQVKNTIITGGRRDILTMDNLYLILQTYVGDIKFTKWDGHYTLTTELASNATAGTTSFVVDDASGIESGDTIRLISYATDGTVLQDQFVTVAATPTTTTVTVSENLEYAFAAGTYVLTSKPFLPDNKVIIRAMAPSAVNTGESTYGNFYTTLSEYGAGNVLSPKPGIFAETIINEVSDPKKVEVIGGVNGLPVRYRNDDFIVATVF